MAKIKESSSVKVNHSKVKRSGVHAKTQTSRSKTSKNYRKAYKGQGR